MKIRAFLLALILIFGAVTFADEKPQDSGPKLGSVAPSFELPDLEGRLVNSKDFKGQVLVLNFWAFWCDTWKEEMPHLEKLVKEEREAKFKLVCISVDGARLSEFLKRTNGGKTPFPVLLDGGEKVSREYSIEHVPTVVVVDAKGVVRKVWSGYPGNEAVLTAVRKVRGN